MVFLLHWEFLDYDKNVTIWIDFLFYFFFLHTAALLSFCGKSVLAPAFNSETLSSSIFSGHWRKIIWPYPHFFQREQGNWKRLRREQRTDHQYSKSQRVCLLKKKLHPLAHLNTIWNSPICVFLCGRMSSTGDGIPQNWVWPAFSLICISVQIFPSESTPQHAGTQQLQCAIMHIQAGKLLHSFLPCFSKWQSMAISLYWIVCKC